MDTLPVSTARDTLSDLVDNAVNTHASYTITRRGVRAAVLVSADEWDAIQETLFWLSRPAIQQDITEAKADIAAGRSRSISAEEMRAELGLPPKST